MYCILPPSASISWPIIYPDSSDARKRARFPHILGRPYPSQRHLGLKHLIGLLIIRVSFPEHRGVYKGGCDKVGTCTPSQEFIRQSLHYHGKRCPGCRIVETSASAVMGERRTQNYYISVFFRLDISAGGCSCIREYPVMSTDGVIKK